MDSGHDPRRDLGKQRYWQACVARWRRSDLSVREFCRRESVREGLFYAWRRELAGRETSDARSTRSSAPARQPTSSTSAFVAVQVVEPLPTVRASAIEIVLPRGRRVRVRPGFDQETLRAVLEILEQPPC